MRIERRMNAFEKKLLEMGTLVRTSMKQATDAFMNQDKDLALAVVEGDNLINYTEKIINDQAAEVFTLMQPVAKDLRLLIGGIKIANDLERIGDYAKNIGRYVVKSKNSENNHYEEVLKLTNVFLENFDKTLAVLKKRDVKEAYSVAKLDDNLDKQYEAFAHFMAKNLLNEPKFSVDLASIAGNIERAGDHSKNICEQVIYIENGRYIDFG